MDRGAWRITVPGATRELGMTEELKQQQQQQDYNNYYYYYYSLRRWEKKVLRKMGDTTIWLESKRSIVNTPHYMWAIISPRMDSVVLH